MQRLKRTHIQETFAERIRHSKSQPSLLPDVDSTLRKIGHWKHIFATDFTSAYYQIPLANESMKYCGVTTPFRGVHVYARNYKTGVGVCAFINNKFKCEELDGLLYISENEFNPTMVKDSSSELSIIHQLYSLPDKRCPIVML